MANFFAFYDHNALLKIFINLEYEHKLNDKNSYYNYPTFPKILI
jgi:hypothetical protein